ncbi:uncharacterized protein [Spinacia oleracea]|uniref:Reverse transcriptase domain-containing protein n=1 Tax=Spinacia oleracea TaxID=3562 RepID=A0ABM3RP44_SPIOL|nr:uncharacterized protein LOC130471355 [Spinacia oleracea]
MEGRNVKPSCLLKVDMQKAYDTVNWSFLQEMLEQLGFPQKFVHLVMECVTTPKFSLMINGSMHGFFKSSRGLRQDDLILCCKGDYPSIYLLLQAFRLFSDSSGLVSNKQKSSIFCHGIQDRDVTRVVEASGFARSSLPFKYLGVPICSKRITAAQCGVLVDKMIARISVEH